MIRIDLFHPIGHRKPNQLMTAYEVEKYQQLRARYLERAAFLTCSCLLPLSLVALLQYTW